MNADFFDFITKPSRENFLKSRDEIITSKDYHPYSNDLELIETLIENADFENALEYNNINILLSPAAHYMKAHTARQLNDLKRVETEYVFAESILNCIRLTGNGTKTRPYVVTRVEDEYDFLFYISEEVSSQKLITENNTTFDLIKTKSGKEVYFNITACYEKLNNSLK